MKIVSIYGEILHKSDHLNLTDCVADALKKGISLRDADFQDADLREANFRGSDLRDADFQWAQIREADFTGANLFEANFKRAEAIRAWFRNADLSGADLSGADLQNSCFRDADLQDTNFRGADLRGADFVRSQLSHADLRGAHLRGAFSCEADLRGTRYSVIELLQLNWGTLSDELTLELMRHDAKLLPNPELMDKWAQGGSCPFRDFQRGFHFKEIRKMWVPGEPKYYGYQLLKKLCEEKSIKL